MPTIVLGKKKKRIWEYNDNKKRLHKWYNNSHWRRLRHCKIVTDPLCEECLKQGRITSAEEAHHIIPINSLDPDVGLIYDWDNLISLCIPCHKEAHSIINAPKRKPVKTWREVHITERK